VGDREVPYDKNAPCDECGEKGAYDFMGDYYCANCITQWEMEQDAEQIDIYGYQN
jgi:uncharacterized Zn ribbon protein